MTDPQNLPLSFVWTIGGIRNIQGPQTDLSSWTWTPAGLPGVYDLMLEVMGSQSLGWEGDAFADAELTTTRSWLRSRANSIEGGTSEVQLNVIAKRVLGLPD